MRPTDLRVARSITSAWFESPQATIICVPPGRTCMWRGRLQVGIEPTTASVFTSTRVIALPFSVET